MAIRKPSLKLVIILASIVVGLIFLGAITAATFLVLNRPITKSDYAQALTQTKTIVATTQAVVTNFTSMSQSTNVNDFNNYVAIAQSNLARLKSETDQLGSLRAMQTDESQSQYQTFQVRMDAFIIHTSNSLSSTRQSHNAFQTCADITTNSSATALTTCANALSKVGNVPDADMQQLITTLTKDYKSLAMATPDQKPAIASAIGKTFTTYTTDIEANQKAVNPVNVINNMTSYLEKKAN